MSASASLELHGALQAYGGVASKLANKHAQMSSGMVLSHLCFTVDKVNIISVDYDWVRYGQGRNDKFRNVRIAGGFVINATELRSVNFSMQAVEGTT